MPSMRGGGSERVMSILISNLNTNKYDVTLVLIKKEGRYLADLPKNLKIIDLDSQKVRYSIFKIINIIRGQKPDIVFSTLAYLNLLIAVIRPFFSKKVKFIARETNTVSVKNKYQPYPKLFDLLYKVFYNNFDLIVSQAEYMKQDLVENYGIKHFKIKVINNPVDINKIRLLENNEQSIFDTNKINLLAVGSMSEQKGFDLLLKAFAKLDDRYFLTILGEGKKQNEIKDLAIALNIDKRVDFLGFQDNPYAYMKEVDLFVLSSRYEGFPNVVLEANACGTPVVAFDCPGGTGEIIENGINGYLVKCGNIDKLAKTIEKAINNNFDKNKIIENTEKKYGLQTIIRQYEEILC